MSVREPNRVSQLAEQTDSFGEMLPRGEVHRFGHREAFNTRGGGSIVGGEHTWGVIQGLDHARQHTRVLLRTG